MDMEKVTFDDVMDDIRVEIKDIAQRVQSIKEYKQSKPSPEPGTNENVGEIMANLTLAYRHLEDASMRIGKVKQHRNGGVSIYDKNVVGSPE
jgi:hypothetical protein